MPSVPAARLVLALAPLCLFAACAGEQPVQTLNDRMAARLSPEIEAGKVAVQSLPDGTQVAIGDDVLFAPGSAQLDAQGQRELTYVIQALLQPAILTVTTANASDSLSGARAAAVQQYFQDHLLYPAPQPAYLPVGSAGVPAQGSTITVKLVSG
jgi:flagellar motor protein MotB